MIEDLYRHYKIPLFVSLGLLLNQLFHTLAYYQSDTSYVFGFPDWKIPIFLAFVFSALIFIISIISIVVFLRFVKKLSIKPHQILYILFILGLISQTFSRGLMKAGFDGLLISIIYLNLIIEKTYASDDASNVGQKVLALLHSELSSLLGVSVGVFIFVWSVMGISFAVQFLQIYYESPLRFGIMVWYGIMILYLGLCFILFVSYVLFNKMIAIRNSYKDKVDGLERNDALANNG